MPQRPQQTYYVVLPAQDAEKIGSLRPISRLMDTDEDGARRVLEIPTFKVVRRFAKRGNAEGFRNQLHALGVEGMVVSDTQIAGFLFLWAKTANKGEGGMAVVDFGGQPLFCPFDDLICVCVGPVLRKDGQQTLLMDLHRKSAPITPRIDTALFDFPTMLKKQDADAYTLVEAIKERAPDIFVDLDYVDVGNYMELMLSRGFATFPGQFGPPEGATSSPYEEKSLRMFDCYSFLTRERLCESPSDSIKG